MFYKIGFLEKVAKLTRKHLCWSNNILKNTFFAEHLRSSASVKTSKVITTFKKSTLLAAITRSVPTTPANI